jgi:hypothetical protein
MALQDRSAVEWLEWPGTFCGCVAVLAGSLLTPEELAESEQETVEADLRDAGVDVGQLLSDKIGAVQMLLQSTAYFDSIHAFTACNEAFNLRGVSKMEVEINDADSVAIGVVQARMLLGAAAFNRRKFSPDIALYVGEALAAEGIDQPPRLLGFARRAPIRDEARGIALAMDPAIAAVFWDRQDSERRALEDLATDFARRHAAQLAALPLPGKTSKEFSQWRSAPTRNKEQPKVGGGDAQGELHKH